MKNLPFRVIWEKTLGEFALIKNGPICIGINMYVRYGATVFAINKGSGDILWQKDFIINGGYGTIFTHNSNLIYAEFRNRKKDVSILLAFDHDGNERWRVNFDSIITQNNFTILDNIICIAGLPSRNRSHFWTIDALSGKVIDSIKMNHPISSIAFFSENKLLACNETSKHSSVPGLVLFDIVSKTTEIISDFPTFKVVISPQRDLVYSIVKENKCEIVIKHHDTFESSLLQLAESEDFVILENYLVILVSNNGKLFLNKVDIHSRHIKWFCEWPVENIPTFYLSEKILMCISMAGSYFINWEDGCIIGYTDNYSYGKHLVLDGFIYLVNRDTFIKAEI